MPFRFHISRNVRVGKGWRMFCHLRKFQTERPEVFFLFDVTSLKDSAHGRQQNSWHYQNLLPCLHDLWSKLLDLSKHVPGTTSRYSRLMLMTRSKHGVVVYSKALQQDRETYRKKTNKEYDTQNMYTITITIHCIFLSQVNASSNT